MGVWSTIAATFWLGVLISISPCPLATNIAATSYLTKRADRPSMVILQGLLYGFGRVAAYAAILFLVLGGLVTSPSLSQALQYWMNRLLGPLLLILAMVLLRILPLPSWLSISATTPRWVDRLVAKGSYLGAFSMGFIFAMALCPISAAIFFGALLPIVAKTSATPLIAPFSFGLGSALPVFVFAVVLAFSAKRLSLIFNFTEKLERVAMLVTGVVFAVVGGYFCLTFNLHVLS